MIDFSKPVQTRSGLPVRILCTDRVHDRSPVIALVSFPYPDMECAVSYTTSGSYGIGVDHRMDLINVPEPHAEVRRAFEAGYPVQYRCDHTRWQWRDCKQPSFQTQVEYRLKPY